MESIEDAAGLLREVDPAAALSELRRARGQLTARGLHVAAQWAAEMSMGLAEVAPGVPFGRGPSEGEDVVEFAVELLRGRSFARAAVLLERTLGLPFEGVSVEGDVHRAWSLDAREADERCASVLGGGWSARALFVYAYARYCGGERRAETSSRAHGDPLGSRAKNAELTGVASLLERARSCGAWDGALSWLLGAVRRRLGESGSALEALVDAGNACPCFWGVWEELGGCVSSKKQVLELLSRLPRHWGAALFVAHAMVELHAGTEALEVLKAAAEGAFGSCAWVRSKVGAALYVERRFDESARVFASLRKADPARVEDAAVYSNVLFVQDDRPALASLARDALAVDPHSAESLCAAANYCSLRGEHERAAALFRRALLVDRDHVSAWTLLGHECIELRNTAAAVEAYRRAIDKAPGDYRAWYGMGQAYEMLGLASHALQYHLRAASLRPRDSRMWCAVGGCLDQAGRSAEAASVYIRAAALGDEEGVAALRLGRLCAAKGDHEAAAQHYARHLEARRSAGDPAAQTCAEALLFLARGAKAQGDIDSAVEYARQVTAMPWPQEAADASTLLRELSTKTTPETSQSRPIAPPAPPSSSAVSTPTQHHPPPPDNDGFGSETDDEQDNDESAFLSGSSAMELSN